MQIAIDTAGGDHAPGNIIDGALEASRRCGFGLVLVGSRAAMQAELARHAGAAQADIRLVDAADVVGMDEDPAGALRRKLDSSVRRAADLVAHGEADAFFSAGNTGATLLAARGAFGLLPGVLRPALAAAIPTRRGTAVLLDVGANVTCRPRHLVQFALMGRLYARLLLDRPDPSVGLLSIGEEATKGNELTRDAHRRLRTADVNFIGNVEARELFSGAADVIVCDGFTGNVALKVGEGLAEMVETLLRDELARTLATRVGYLLSIPALRRFGRRVDYSEVGGAPLLGVAGLCIVGHGRSSAKAVRNAVTLAYRYAREGFVERVGHEIGAASTRLRVVEQGGGS